MRRLRVFVAACAVIASGAAFAGSGATNIESYAWTHVRPTAPFDPTMWAPRAGLQAVELRKGLPSDVNKFLVENDVWRLSPSGPDFARP